MQDVDSIFRQTMERNLRSYAQVLCQELEKNELEKKPERKVHTATVVVSKDDGRFIAVDGSAHMMEELFVELFRRRPELRSVVQDALNSTFWVEDR